MPDSPSEYLEKSFLRELITLSGVTDISYNGRDIYYATNAQGRSKAGFAISQKEAGDFLRQIANLSEKQFSYSSPILDVSFGRYRLNAVNSSLGRVNNEKCYSFSLRLASGNCLLDQDSSFFGSGAEQILLSALSSGESVIIGGATSTGKTELQKWLLLHMKGNSRVIAIDNVEELDLIDRPSLDLTTWIVNEIIPEATFSSLIRNALRHNPDYIIVAEARGKEMLDAIHSAMSGHPIITTIHSKSLWTMPSRIVKMAMMSGERLYQNDLLEDIKDHFRYFVFLQKDVAPDGRISRHIASIGKLSETTGRMNVIYQRV
jgi:pilus assembly protein CpaF